MECIAFFGSGSYMFFTPLTEMKPESIVLGLLLSLAVPVQLSQSPQEYPLSDPDRRSPAHNRIGRNSGSRLQPLAGAFVLHLQNLQSARVASAPISLGKAQG